MKDKPDLQVERPDLDEKLSELEILRQSLEEKTKKEKEVYDQLLRMGADFENFRKRAEGRISQARKFGKEEILLEVLLLADSLIHALQASKKATDLSSLKEGLLLVNQQFEKFLKDQGVAPIKTEGEKLDPHKHEVIAQEDNDDVEEGVILGEIQRGYMIGDQVIRTAKVRVAGKSNKEKVGQSQESQEEK